MRRKLHENGLSIVLFGLFFFSLLGQIITGLHEYNEDQREHNQPDAGYTEYLNQTLQDWDTHAAFSFRAVASLVIA